MRSRPPAEPPPVVFITGSSSGIGRAAALCLAQAGYRVLAGVRRPQDGQALSEANAGITPVLLDVTDPTALTAAAQQIESICGPNGLAGLVNNAGICVVGPVECVDLADWRRQFEVNLFGSIAVTQAMLPLLRKHAALHGSLSARIVNISSVTGQISSPLFGAYSSSKFALEAFTHSLRMEVRAQGIGVSLVNPGTIQSEIWRKERDCVDTIRRCPLARQIYAQLIDNVSSFVFRTAEKAIPADRVAQSVLRCFTRATPPIRLRVGWEARVGFLAHHLLPERLFDFLMMRTMGVPSDRPQFHDHSDQTPGVEHLAGDT